MENCILQTENLGKKFTRNYAVNNISINIKEGSIYGLVGRNGAGKTTLMKLITGLSTPTGGKITIMGKSGRAIGSVRENIGSLLEEPGLYENLNAYDNLKAKALFLGKYNDEYIKGILKKIGLENAGKKKAKKFSLGMKQRLGIGLALIGNPKLLILDEPINGLDPQGVAEIRNTLININKEDGITILISSHILEELSKIATVYGFIEKGKLVKELTADELIRECREHVKLAVDNVELTKQILEKMQINDYQEISEGHMELYGCEDKISMINKELVMGGVLVSEIYASGIDLESYYLNMIGGFENA
ncbi:MAG: ATP-binding cassette domain-containing protein [Lachnospiraceae bacterium]|nr:ATP-binding cassette domain-containing protein [Lachnospiraceae bacterium]